MFVLRLLLKNAFRHKLRTLLTMVGLVVAIWALAGPALAQLFEQAIGRVAGL